MTCAVGKFVAVANGKTKASCDDCEAGKSSAGLTVCTACGAGTYALAAASVCTQCAAGKYGKAVGTANQDAADDCAHCAAGKFSSTAGLAHPVRRANLQQ